VQRRRRLADDACIDVKAKDEDRIIVLHKTHNTFLHCSNYQDIYISHLTAKTCTTYDIVNHLQLRRRTRDGLQTESYMKVTYLTMLILCLNALIDGGKHDDITLDDIKDHIDDGTVLDFINQRCAGDIDLTWANEDFKKWYVPRLQDILGGYRGRERRKWGIENKGLCLLLAWTNEIVQQGDDLTW